MLEDVRRPVCRRVEAVRSERVWLKRIHAVVSAGLLMRAAVPLVMSLPLVDCGVGPCKGCGILKDRRNTGAEVGDVGCGIVCRNSFTSCTIYDCCSPSSVRPKRV